MGGHLRIVPAEPTVAFVSRQPKPFVVRWSSARRGDDAIGPDDEVIGPSRGYPRLLSLVVHSPLTPDGRPSRMRDGAAPVHLMGTELHRLVAQVEVAPGFVRTAERTIEAKRDRAEVEQSFAREAGERAKAPADVPDFETQRSRATLRRVQARRAAAERGVLHAECFTAWDRLFNAMIALGPALEDTTHTPIDAGVTAEHAEVFSDTVLGARLR